MFRKVSKSENLKRSKSPEARSVLSSYIVVFFVICSFFYSLTTSAQCAMCRAAIESEGNGAKAEAINDGIVYLMIIPYLLVAAIGYAVYRMYKKKKA